MNFVSSITLQFKDAFSAGFSSAQNSFAGMKSSLDDINQNQSMNRLAADLAMASSLTDPFRQKLSAMMDEPSRLAGAFESSMKNIQAITGSTSAEMDVLNKTLLKIGSEHAAGPLAVADAYGDVAGGITNTAAQLPVLNASFLLAEAGQADLGVATNGLVKILNSYNFSAGDAASVTEKAAWASDVMTQAVGMGVGSMQEFVSAMAPVSGAAATVGIGFDEIGSTMAYMTSTTESAATAGTKLESFMTALQKPSDMLSNKLKSIGIESGSAMLKQYGLAESAKIVSDLFGGSSDLITQALGRQEAKAAVISLMSSQYTAFASEFGQAMQNNVTAEAAAIQNQSYESKLARLQAAHETLSVGIGQDINSIKGFFVDMGAGFLTNVAAPIMSSPVGGAISKIAAFAGLGAKGILDMGSGALNTASQLITFTAAVNNAGGIAKLFGSSLSLLTTPFAKIGKGIVTALPKLAAWIASMWSAAAANWAALGPIAAIVLGVAALAFGAVMLVKHWDAVSAFFVKMWERITNSFAIAGAWIRGFFSSLWESLKAPLSGFINFFITLWQGAVSLFTALWTYISDFFLSLWNGLIAVVMNAANWFGGVWAAVTSGFTAAWTVIYDFFTRIWEGIKGVVLGFVQWLSPVIDVILAPFRAIGKVIDGIMGKTGGGLGKAVNAGNTAAGEMAAKLSAKPVGTELADSKVQAAPVVAPKLPGKTTANIAAPELSGAATAPVPATAVQKASASFTPRANGFGGEVSRQSSSAFLKAISGSGMDSLAASTAVPGVGTESLGAATAPGVGMDEQTAMNFKDALPKRQEPIEMPWSKHETPVQKNDTRTFKIENLYLQADDCKRLFDLMAMLENAVHDPQEEAA